MDALASLMTTSDKVAQTVDLGQGFNNANSMKFSSGSAPFNIVSDTYLTAVVPVEGTTDVEKSISTNYNFRVIDGEALARA